MASAPWLSASPPAAPELLDYIQLSDGAVPEGSGAIRAYRGFIRPFSDDATARRVLRALESGRPINIDGGRLDADYPDLPEHPYEEFLIDMAAPFIVLALEFPDPQRPRAYLLDPPMVARLSECCHLRRDKKIHVEGKTVPALCVYSGALFRFKNDRPQVHQLLDQTATYLAKYLVWLRTRNLFRYGQNGKLLLRKRRPGDPVTTAEISRAPEVFWDGHWPGLAALSSHADHLAMIKPGDECWCWSGLRYGDCCRPREAEIVANRERESLVRRLMLAVHSTLASRA